MTGLGDLDSFNLLLSDAQALEASGEIDEATRRLREAALLNPGHGLPFSRLSIIAARRAWGEAGARRAATPPATPRVSMTALGARGRFGNQILQYAYLRLFAARAGAVAETPDWIGRYVFAIDDPLAEGSLPQIVESQFDAPFAIRRECRPSANVDLHGYFAFDTAHYREARDEFRGLFALRESAARIVDAAWAKLGGNERTVVAIHIRRGDFGYGRFWIAPVEWYFKWLNEVLPQLRRPIVYVASDDPVVRDEFARFDPVSARDVDGFPEDLEYLTDFFMLQKAHALAISNSTFSFVAAMLGRPDAIRVRPDPIRSELVSFDPWSAQVVLDPP